MTRVASRQGHAGTVPMALRADPLAGAAEAVAAVERRCGGGRYADPPHDAGMHPGGRCTHEAAVPGAATVRIAAALRSAL